VFEGVVDALWLIFLGLLRCVQGFHDNFFLVGFRMIDCLTSGLGMRLGGLVEGMLVEKRGMLTNC